MSIQRYTLYQLLLYGCALFGPGVVASFFAVSAKSALVLMLVFQIVCATLMIYLLPSLKDIPKVEQKSPKTSLKRVIQIGILGIFFLFFVQGIANIVQTILFNDLSASENTQTILQIIKENLIFIVLVGIIGPIMEEIFFRRTLTNFIAFRFSFLPGVLFSSTLFSLAHQDGHFLVYFSMGIALCFLYQKTGNLLTSIIAHCGMNTAIVFLSLLSTFIN